MDNLGEGRNRCLRPARHAAVSAVIEAFFEFHHNLGVPQSANPQEVLSGTNESPSPPNKINELDVISSMDLPARATPASHTGQLSEGSLTAVTLSVLFSVFATIAVGLRFWVRRIKRTGPLLEDWLILAALIFAWSYVIVVFLLAYRGGLGWPPTELTPDTQYTLAGQTNWPIANALIKVSICLAFIRIFFTRTFRIVATTVYSVAICWALMTILVAYLICTPLSKLFTPTSRGHCGNTTAAYMSISAIDVALDIAVFALPVPCLYKLQVSRHTKIALGATFALGAFTIVAGLVRLVSIAKISFQTDLEQAELDAAYWSAIELAVGIMVACAMTLRPLLDRMLTTIKEYTSKVQLTGQSRRTITNKSATDGPMKFSAEDSFQRLHETEDLQLQHFPPGRQDIPKYHTRRASLESV